MQLETNSAIRRPALPALTSLRFFAAMLVYVFHLHAYKLASEPRWLSSIAEIGYSGVSLFFVLSGFILTYNYAGHAINLRDFWRARFARLYPVYLFSLILAEPIYIYLLFGLVIPVSQFPDLIWIKGHFVEAMTASILLLQTWFPLSALAANSVAWSLSVEAFFYLIFPFAVGWLNHFARRLTLWMALFWGLSLAFTLTYAAFQSDAFAEGHMSPGTFWLNLIRFHPLVRLPEFLFGMATGLIFVRQRIQVRFAPLLILIGLAGMALVAAFSNRIPYPVIHTGLLTPAFAALIYGLALGSRWTRWMSARPLILLGNASYSFYLTHLLVVLAVLKVDIQHPGTYSLGTHLLCLSLALGLAIAIYYAIEVPARLRLRRSRAAFPFAKIAGSI